MIKDEERPVTISSCSFGIALKTPSPCMFCMARTVTSPASAIEVQIRVRVVAGELTGSIERHTDFVKAAKGQEKGQVSNRQ